MRNSPDKNPFRGVSDLLSRAAPAKRNLHFLSYLIDLIIVFISSYLIFLAGNAIVSNSDGYKSNYANYETEITYYQDMVVEAHLAEYLDRDNYVLAEDEDLAVKMAISQILNSYSHDKPESPDFLENPEPKLKEIYNSDFYSDCFVPISFSNDYISKFIIDYVPLHNENEELIRFGDKTPSSYTISIYKGHVAKYEKLKFIYSTDDSEIPYLRTDVAYDIYKYLVRSDGFERELYDSFVNFYTAMLTDCEDVVFKSNSYQNGRYQDYLKYRKSITQSINTTLIISIFIAYYLAVFVPQIIFKDGRSFGKIFMRLAVINTDKSEVEIWKLAIRSIFTAISYLFLAFFLILLPPFNGTSMILYLPYFTIGSLDITLLNIIIIIFVFASANGIFMLLTHDKRNVADLLSQTVTVDVTCLDEPDYDEKNESFS